MDVEDLVDAALVGLDKGEVVTIPPLADEGLWIAYNEARLAMAPQSFAARSGRPLSPQSPPDSWRTQDGVR